MRCSLPACTPTWVSPAVMDFYTYKHLPLSNISRCQIRKHHNWTFPFYPTLANILHIRFLWDRLETTVGMRRPIAKSWKIFAHWAKNVDGCSTWEGEKKTHFKFRGDAGNGFCCKVCRRRWWGAEGQRPWITSSPLRGIFQLQLQAQPSRGGPTKLCEWCWLSSANVVCSFYMSSWYEKGDFIYFIRVDPRLLDPYEAMTWSRYLNRYTGSTIVWKNGKFSDLDPV